MAAPTNLPSGKGFTQTIIERTCLPGTWNTLTNDYFVPARMTDAGGISKEFPRLETVLESVTSIIGLGALSAFSICDHARPNDRHAIIASHVKSGGSHITTNFDRCIEFCLSAPLHPRVIHVHGIYDNSFLGDLGARLSTVAAGLTSDLAQQLTGFLTSSRGLAFLGYSGSDFFDINPFLAGLSAEDVDLSHLHVVWLKHANCSPVELSLLTGLPGSTILRALQECGAAITYMEGDAAVFLQELADAWSLTVTTVPSGSTSTVSTSRPISWGERLLATTQLYTSMGIGKEVVNLKTSLEALSRQCRKHSDEWIKIHHFLNDGYRNVGRYSEAINVAKKIGVRPPYSRLLAFHRFAGDYWLRGNHIKAAWYFLSAFLLTKCAVHLPNIGADERSKIIQEQRKSASRPFIGYVIFGSIAGFSHYS